jgi:hypothetical protein
MTLLTDESILHVVRMFQIGRAKKYESCNANGHYIENSDGTVICWSYTGFGQVYPVQFIASYTPLHIVQNHVIVGRWM